MATPKQSETSVHAYDVLIVGAGHAGAQAAIALRQAKFAGSIALVSDEPEMPYERPPLSKDYLSGDKTFERILIRPAAFWAQHGIALLTGERVSAVFAEAKRVETESRVMIDYRHLVWAAGGSPRRLACDGHDVIGVHTVRTRADVDRMVGELGQVSRVVVIGGGYIGLEAAAVLKKLGKKVTVLEALDRVLARVAGEPLSRFYEAEHRAHGVDVRLGASVDRVESKDGRVAGVHLVGGEAIACEMVIIGIGTIPALEPLRAAGEPVSVLVLRPVPTVIEELQPGMRDVRTHRDCFRNIAERIFTAPDYERGCLDPCEIRRCQDIALANGHLLQAQQPIDIGDEGGLMVDRMTNVDELPGHVLRIVHQQLETLARKVDVVCLHRPPCAFLDPLHDFGIRLGAACGHQLQRAHTRRLIDGEPGAGPAAERLADEVCPLDAERIQVGDQVRAVLAGFRS